MSLLNRIKKLLGLFKDLLAKTSFAFGVVILDLPEFAV